MSWTLNSRCSNSRFLLNIWASVEKILFSKDVGHGTLVRIPILAIPVLGKAVLMTRDKMGAY
ncbi:hypothetical protein PsorP6_015292 [Peronosclerospora sorghi]|uniref:Uncharacterized protein n=1 Tax=Peronosclerospora sorghi TaxID=230839 RepID=A0ACC0VRP8_9STRA|nr:hypothetical protein PsorP6_015292 [Peronosclerospora sorghi]